MRAFRFFVRIVLVLLIIIVSAGLGCSPNAPGSQQTQTPSSKSASANANTGTDGPSLAEPIVTPLSAASASPLQGGARQVIQRGATSTQNFSPAIALSGDGFAATWSDDDMLRIWHLPSRMLVRVVPAVDIDKGHFSHPVKLVWDTSTHEVLFRRPGGVLGVGLDGKVTPRAWSGTNATADHILRVPGTANGDNGKSNGWVTTNYGNVKLLDAKGTSISDVALDAGTLLNAVSMAADGHSVVGASKAGLVHLSVDASSGKLGTPKTTPLPQASVLGESIALSPNGETALVCVNRKDERALVRVSKLTTPSPVVSTVNVEAPALLSCRPVFTGNDSAVIAIGGDLVGIAVSTGTVQWRTVLPEMAIAMDTTGDGRQVITMRVDGGVTLYDARGGAPLADLGARVLAPETLSGNQPAETGITFLSTGDLASISVNRGTLSTPLSGHQQQAGMWSMQDGQRIRRLPINWGEVFTVDRAGTVHAAWTDPRPGIEPCAKTERGVWFTTFPATTPNPTAQRSTAKGSWPPTNNNASVACVENEATSVVAIDPMEGRVVTQKRTKEKMPLVVHSTRKGDKPFSISDELSGGMCVASVWFARDGKHLLSAPCSRGGLSELHVWDPIKGTKIGKLTANPKDPEGIVIGGGPQRAGYSAEATSDDGTALAVGGESSVTVYELPSKKVLGKTLVLPRDGGGDAGTVTALAFAPGSRDRLFIGTSRGVLFASATGSGTSTLTRSDSGGGAIRLMTTRADGQRVATVSDDGATRVWDTRANAQLLASMVEFQDEEWVTTTPRGAYLGTPEAAERVGWIFDAPTEGFTFEQFAKTFNRPDIVAKRLSGGEAAAGGEDGADSIANARPPRVTLISKPPVQSDTGKVQIKVRAQAAPARKVATLHAFVEGRPTRVVDVKAEAADVTLEVPLLAGNDVVSLVAFDDAGRASNQTSFEIISSSSAAATTTRANRQRPDIWVVAVGVGKYPKLSPAQQLEATTNDANGIAAAFAEQAGAASTGKPYEHAHTTVLLDDEVTDASVDRALRGLSAMRADDVAVVFLAGHGVKLPGPRGDMVFLTGAASLRAADIVAAGIGWSKIGAALAGARGRVLVLVDACHSGHLTQDYVIPNSTLANAIAQGERAGMFVFAASKGRQESLEAGTSRSIVLDAKNKDLVTAPAPSSSVAAATSKAGIGSGHGYFTGALLQALQAPSTDMNGNSVIELSELVSQVALRVTRASDGKQTPWVVRRELFGDFGVARAHPSGR